MTSVKNIVAMDIIENSKRKILLGNSANWKISR